MKKILGIVVLGLFFCNYTFAEFNYEPVIKTYTIEDHVLTISNNGFLHEVYLCKPTAKKCKEIGKLRIEGKDYQIKDGDVLHFRVNP